MRVALISSSFYPAFSFGGPIFSTWELSKRLSEKNTDIYVSTTNSNLNKKLHVDTNNFISIKKGLFVKYYNEEIINIFSFSFLKGVLSDIRNSDIVYLQYLFHYTVLISLIYSFFCKKKVILCPRGSFSAYTLNGNNKYLKYLWIIFFIKPFLNMIHWHASSHLEKRDILQMFPKASVSIISDVIDFESLQEGIVKLNKEDLIYNYTGKKFSNISHVFFSMGRLHHIKRFDSLIHAFYKFLKTENNAKLIIAGPDYGVREKLVNQIHELGLIESVFLIGEIDHNQKKNILNNCDYFTLASDFESFGIVILEAISCGLPVVISNNTPWNDIEDNNCGIFTSNKIEDLHNSFKKVIKTEYNHDNIKNYTRLKYNSDVIADQFNDLINVYIRD